MRTHKHTHVCSWKSAQNHKTDDHKLKWCVNCLVLVFEWVMDHSHNLGEAFIHILFTFTPHIQAICLYSAK